MTHLFFESALLPGGWARDVRLSIGPDGSIARGVEGARARSSERTEGIALPGVPNLHSHAFQRAMAGLTERGSAAPGGFWSWRERMYAFLQALSPGDVEAIAAQLYVEMLRHGFTAVTEFHYLRNDPRGRPYDDPVETGKRLLAAAEAVGMGITLLPALYRAGGFGGEPAADGQRRFTASPEEILGDVAVLGALAGPSARVGLALHSLRAVGPADLAVAVEALRSFDPEAPIHIHVAEQEREVEECLAWSGARPVAWLLDHAPVDERWCLVHTTHVVAEELRGVADSGAVVGLCPTTEANLGDGVFPFAEYAEAEGRWGVGTDSHVSVSPAAELRLLEYGQRLTRRARNVAAGPHERSTGRTLLEEACRGGAAACGRPVGALARGFRADLVVLNPDHAALVGRSGDEVIDSWLFSGEDTPVRDVMVGGRWVVRDGRHPAEEETLAAYRTVAERVAGRRPDARP